jgi:hypothetical protein
VRPKVRRQQPDEGDEGNATLFDLARTRFLRKTAFMFVFEVRGRAFVWLWQFHRVLSMKREVASFDV